MHILSPIGVRAIMAIMTTDGPRQSDMHVLFAFGGHLIVLMTLLLILPL